MLSPRKGLVLVKPYFDPNETAQITVTAGKNGLQRGVVVNYNVADEKKVKRGSVVVYSNGEEIKIDKDTHFLVELDDIRGSLTKNSDHRYPRVY